MCNSFVNIYFSTHEIELLYGICDCALFHAEINSESPLVDVCQLRELMENLRAYKDSSSFSY